MYKLYSNYQLKVIWCGTAIKRFI